jgi:hypothetical protein
MATHVDTQECEAVLVEDAHVRPMMGLDDDRILRVR